MGVDIARYGGDKSVATILQRRGPIKWEVKHVERWSKRDLMETTGRIIDLQSRFKPHSTVIDADGIGAGVVDRMSELKVNVTEFHGGMNDKVTNKKQWGNLKTEWFCKLEELIAMERIGCKFETTLESLLTIMYTHKSNGQKVLLTKERMKAMGINSPDDADSIMMAYYATSFMDRKMEDNEDFRTPPRAAQHSNPFKIAGYR
jgi:alpha-L-arabinofuranosidase